MAKLNAKAEGTTTMIRDARVANPEGEITLDAVEVYDASEFIKALQNTEVAPYVAQKEAARAQAAPDSPSDDAWHNKSRSGLRGDHGGLKPSANAHLGKGMSTKDRKKAAHACKAALQGRVATQLLM